MSLLARSRRSRSRTVLLGGGIALAACADTPESMQRVAGPSLAVAGGGAAASAFRSTIFASDERPARPEVDDGQPVELGLRFCARQQGRVRGIRFFRGARNVGPHVGTLWSVGPDGALSRVAEVPFADTLGTGWVQADFPAGTLPRLEPGRSYVVSYFTPSGFYAASNDFFTAPRGTPLFAVFKDTAATPNGVYRYGARGEAPTSTFRSTNYWVDLDVQRETPFGLFDACAPEAAATPIVDDRESVELGITFVPKVDGRIGTVRFRHDVGFARNPDGSPGVTAYPVSIWSASGARLGQGTARVSQNPTSGVLTGLLDAPVSVRAGETYIASYRAPAGRYAFTPERFTRATESDLFRLPANAGVFTYAAPGTAPRESFRAANYFVDIGFEPAVPAPVPPTDTLGGPIAVSVPTCAPSATGSAGDCLPAASVVRGRAFGIWQPDPRFDSCPRAVHDAWWTLGPDGRAYPTWHPPVVPAGRPGAGCTFGHEHGRDPAGSRLASWGLPFGYVNEYYNADNPAAQRNEDHVGHKVDWENGWTFTGTRGSTPVTLRGDLLMKVHQGTHSRDALANNLHEVFYYLRLADGTEMRLRVLNGFGSGGEFRVECANNDPRGTRRTVAAGTPTPPQSEPGRGGNRLLPTVDGCPLLVPQGQRSNFATLTESWQSGVGIESQARNAGDLPVMAAGADPYFQVRDPARVHTPDASVQNILRTVDLCYVTGALAVRGEPSCDSVRALGRVAWNDPRSPFRGTVRVGDVGNLDFRNESSTRVWYTRPIGADRDPRTPEAVPDRPDPARNLVIEQIVSPTLRLQLNGGVFPVRDFATRHVHAPN